MKKILILTALVLAASCAKKDDSKNAQDNNNNNDQGTGITTTNYTSECTNLIVDEQKDEAGKVTRHETTLKRKYAIAVTKNKAVLNVANKKSSGEYERSIVTTKPDGSKETEPDMKYSYETQRTLTTTPMGNDTFKDVDAYETIMKAKDGYDFGKDNNDKKITEKTIKHIMETVYTESNHITVTKSYVLDGKDQGPTPGRYLNEETREGDTVIEKDSLMEPFVDPSDKNYTVVSDVNTCRIKQVAKPK